MINHRNFRVAGLSVAVIAGMLGLTAASVPLYRLFCAVTGYGGTTQRAEVAPGSAADVAVEVRFNADHAPDLPWRFAPEQRSLELKPGEERLAFFIAENLSDKPIVGVATFNVTPHKVGPYFVKLACFCFEGQALQPGEKVEMPVSFYVDPAMLEDIDTEEVRVITLSYTFFVDADATAKLRAKQTPDANS